MLFKRVILEPSLCTFSDNKPGEYKAPDLNDPNVKQYYNGSLVLNHVRPSDAGQYLCQASNGIGAHLGLVIKVHVQGKKITNMCNF